MARSKSKPAPEGHNSGGQAPSDEDIAALQHLLSTRIRTARKAAAEAKAVYDSKLQAVSSEFDIVKAELRYTRKEFEGVLAAQDMSEEEFRAAEAKRTTMFARQGLPVGAQLDLPLGDRGDTADEAARTYAMGHKAGKDAVGFGEAPKHISPVMVQDWLRGWHDGQKINLDLIAKGEAVLAAKAKAPKPGEMAPEPEAEAPKDGDPVAEELEAARKLSESNWMRPSKAEAEFAAA